MNITIRHDPGSNPLEAVAASLRSARRAEAVGHAVRDLLEAHLLARDRSVAHPGGAHGRSHYWAKWGRSASFEADDTGADVSVESTEQRGFRLHLKGGTVTPGKNLSFVSGNPTKYLTLPASAAAYGERAVEFPGLALIWAVRDGKPRPIGLGLPVSARTEKKIGYSSRAMYWFAKSATLREDRTVLPSDEQFKLTMVRAVRDLASGKFGRSYA